MVCVAPGKRKGFLHKRKKDSNSWNNRYFLLDGETLRYYRKLDVRMYICLSAYVGVFICTHGHNNSVYIVCMYVCMYVCIVCMYGLYVHTVCMYVCGCVSVCSVYACMCTCTYVCMHVIIACIVILCCWYAYRIPSQRRSFHC